MPRVSSSDAVLRLRLLSAAAQDLLAADEPDHMLQGLFARARAQLPIDVYFNFMVDPDGKALHLASSGGVSASVARDLRRLAFGQAVCGTVARTGEPMCASHIQESDDPLTELVRGFGIRAYACNPLRIGERVLGTLSFGSRSVDRFGEEDLELFRAICRCVTFAYERLNGEAALREIGEALRRNRAELIEQMRRLEKQDRRKDDFLAVLGHELRNPLAALRSGIDVLLDDQDPVTSRDLTQRLDVQVDHLERLIDDLLDITRISRGKVTLRKQVCDLADVVQRSSECVMARLLPGQTLDLEVPRPLHVDGDPDRLEQVVTNLLDNAIAHSPRDGRITLRVEAEAPWVSLRLRDAGRGVPAHLQDQIFEAFAQGRDAHGAGRGLGLGLAVVRQLVELHGGEAWVQSDGDGRGSEFGFRIPGPRPAPERSGTTGPRTPDLETTRGAPDAADGRDSAPAPRVLIVDDNRDAATSLAKLLRRRGCVVRTCHTGEEARDAALALRPDAVLLDLGLPDMDGFGVARALRREPALRRVRIVALTGYSDDVTARRVREAQFDHLLLKPTNVASVLAQIGPCRTDA